MTLPTRLTLIKLMAGDSKQIEHAINVSDFKKHLEAVIEAGRTTEMGIKDVLMDRLHRKG